MQLLHDGSNRIIGCRFGIGTLDFVGTHVFVEVRTAKPGMYDSEVKELESNFRIVACAAAIDAFRPFAEVDIDVDVVPAHNGIKHPGGVFVQPVLQEQGIQRIGRGQVFCRQQGTASGASGQKVKYTAFIIVVFVVDFGPVAQGPFLGIEGF